MKFILILVCLALYVAHIQAQSCRGRIRSPDCRNGKNEGRGGRLCNRNANNNMWWYNSSNRRCLKMAYKGCGGNKNRYCTKAACERKCR